MKTNKYLIQSGCAALVISWSVTAGGAQPQLARLQPQGGQRGTELTVAALGNRLGDGPYQVLTYDAGLTVADVKKVDAKQLQLMVQLAPDCRLGRHALRLRTASGLSNLLTFHVGALTETEEIEPNNVLAEAQEIPLDVVVNGIVKQEDIDVFAVDTTAGERLSVEIEGLRLGRTFFDPAIELFDERGSLLAASDDRTATRQDPFVSLVADKTGRVLIHVRESAYRGSDQANYRLHVGRFPRPAAVYPPAAAAGQKAEVNWLGVASGQLTQVIDVPETSEKFFVAHASDEQGIAPTGMPIYVAATPPTCETEENDHRQGGTLLSAPGVACGVIQAAGDRDCFRFVASKGQNWDLRVRARELRSPLDAVLRVFNAKGKQLAANDDDQGHPDSYLRFQVPDDGAYVLEVEDRLQRGRAEMVYALEIAPPPPVVEVKLDERRRYEATVIEVPRGGRTAAMLSVTRRNVGGPLAIRFANLPEGVAYQATPLAGNYNRVAVLFSASDTAAPAATLATVTAELTEKPQPLATHFQHQTWLVRGRNNRDVWSHLARRAPLAVTRELPFSLRLHEPQAPLVQSGEMKLKVFAERDEGFDNAIAVRMLYNPPGISSNRSRSIRQQELEAEIPMTANSKARIGDWPIAVVGETSINGQIVASTQFVTLQVAAPYFDISVPTLTMVPGATQEIALKLDHRTPFEGAAELQLVRLPRGVSAEPIQVAAGEQTATFKVQVADDVQLGRHRGIACRAKLRVGGEPVIYTQGYAELRVDPPPVETGVRTVKQKSRGDDPSS